METMQLVLSREMTPEQLRLSVNGFFEAPVKEAQNLEIEYCTIVNSTVITPELCKKAGELRRRYVKVRTGTEKIHKQEKSFYYEVCKAMDAVKREITEFVTEREKNLKNVEEYFENIKKQEKEKIRFEREELLRPYIDPENGLCMPSNLDDMDDFAFNLLLDGYKLRSQSLKKSPEHRVIETIKSIDVSDCSDEFKKEFNDFLSRISKFTN